MDKRLGAYVIILICCVVRVHGFDYDCGINPYPWQPKGPKSQDSNNSYSHNKGSNSPTTNAILCHGRCKNLEDDTYCCSCNNCPVWDWEETEVDLYVEFVTVLGKSLVISDAPFNSSSVYRIRHTQSGLTYIPSNICDWDTDSSMSIYGDVFVDMKPFWGNVVEIDFGYNNIQRLEGLNCLTRLHSMALQGNKITHISNTSFAELSNLHYLNIANNLVKTIDPATFGAVNLNLFQADLTWNYMTTVDVMNMRSLYPYCKINFAHNNISAITNVQNYSLDMTEDYGPGFTDVSYNEVEEFPNFKKLLNLESWNQMGRIIGISVDFTNNPTRCDCTYEPFMSLSEKIIAAIMLDHFKVTCQSPDDLQGDQIKDVPLDRLVCPVLANSGCQKPECLCIDEPNKNRLFIDCSDSGLKTMPDIPESEYSSNIFLNLSGNHIEEIRNVSYLTKISVLDLSRNDIIYLDPNISKKLENASFLDISNNPKIRRLPQVFQNRDVCSTYMKGLRIQCGCPDTWIPTWLRLGSCDTTDYFFICEVPKHGLVPALEFSEDQLDCFPSANLFLVATLVAGGLLALMVMSMLTYYFRYEILILCVRIRNSSTKNKVVPRYKFDVYISYNEIDDDVRKWVEHLLVGNLTEAGYTVYIPRRNLLYGQERNEQVLAAIQDSRNVLVVLSNTYFADNDDEMRPWTENEWKYGWNNFKTSRFKNIIIVDFDYVSALNYPHPQIRAVLRVGCTVDFRNYDRCIMGDIYTKLGPPFRNPELPENDINNTKPKFSLNELFTVQRVVDAEDMFAPEDDYVKEELPDKSDALNKIDHRVKTKKKIVNNGVGGYERKCQYRKCYACQNS